MSTPTPITPPPKTSEQSIILQANRILSDASHVLNSEHVLMNSGRRDTFPLCMHNRYKHSFIPLSITLVNGQPLKGRRGEITPENAVPPIVCL